MVDLLWPTYEGPDDLAVIEAVPQADRGLPATTYDVLVRAAARWPDRVALSVLPDAQRFAQAADRTFAQLLADVHRFANVLHAHGVRRGDVVALLAPNCDELITATLAAQLSGIAAPVNGSLSQQTVHQLLRRAGARVVIAAGPGLAPDIWTTAQQLVEEGDVDALLALRPTSEAARAEPLPVIAGVHVAYLSEEAEGQPRDGFIGELPTGPQIAALFHTGGTTGTPKLAAHTHANEVSDAWMIAANGLLPDDAVVFAALPLFHVNALLVTVLAPLFKGLRVIWAGPLGYREPSLYASFWKLVELYRVTSMSAVPTVYSALARCPVDADISSLQVAIVGASPLPNAVRDGFESATSVRLVEGYGLTEATCATALSFPDHPRPGAVGQRMPYQQVKVVKVAPEGEWVDLPVGAVGVLVISGPTVFPGYVTGRGRDGLVLDGLGKLHDGWLDTGDLGLLDADGFIYLTGRAKDLIIRGGHNIDPAVIENALLSHPEVTGAQAVGRPDVHSGEVPVAFVTLVPGSTTSAHEVRAWAHAHVPEEAAAPKTVTVLDALPVTEVGKPYKPGLRAEAARQAIADALRDLPQVASLRVVVEDGSIQAVVGLAEGADESPVKEALDCFAVAWRLEGSGERTRAAEQDSLHDDLAADRTSVPG